jgi:hypothetical protein
LENEKNATRQVSLARELAEVAANLGPADAARICASAVHRLREAARELAEDDYDRRRLLLATGELMQELDSEFATRLSRELAQQTCSSLDIPEFIPAGWPIPGQGVYFLDDILTIDSREEVGRRVTAMPTAVGLAIGQPLAALSALSVAGEPLPCRLSTQNLVDLLKMPTLFGVARNVVLKHLGNRYGRAFANHWEFVRFATEQHLDLDFTSPPRRPAQP